MPSIIKIGYCQFLIRRAADAATVIKAMAEAVPVESRYKKDHEVFFPSTRRHDSEVSMRTVQATDLLQSDPGEADLPDEDAPANGARQHPDRKAAKLVKDSPRLLGL